MTVQTVVTQTSEKYYEFTNLKTILLLFLVAKLVYLAWSNQLLEPTPEQVFWWDLWPCGGLVLEQAVPEGLTLWKSDSYWRTLAHEMESH